MKRKNKTKEIEEILSHFERETIVEAIENLREKELPILRTKDLPDPGPEIAIGNLERIIDGRNFLPASFLEEGAIAQKAVARIAFREPYGSFGVGDGWATGFMVSPSLFLTNNHVIPSESFAKKLAPQFNYQNDVSGSPLNLDEYTFDPDDVFYTNPDLDCTLIRVNKKCYNHFSKFNNNLLPKTLANQGNEFTTIHLNPLDMEIDYDGRNIFVDDWIRNLKPVCTLPGLKWGFIKLKKKRLRKIENYFLNIVQHPAARRKEVALQENTITNIYSDKIRYTTDTEPGSSGSPVFNNFWDLVALHHAAGENDPKTNQWVSNQGIRIDKIVKALHSRYNGTATDRKVLSELGIQ